jgi:hypothetical protein
MDGEHVKGAAVKVKGAIKDTAGKVTGDRELQAEGKFARPRVLRMTRPAMPRTRSGMQPRRRKASRTSTT